MGGSSEMVVQVQAGDVLLSGQMKETARFDECRDCENLCDVNVFEARLYFQLEIQIHFSFNNSCTAV